MPQRQEPIVAVFPGSFDPVTHGHLDLIHRAAALFNKLVVGVGINPDKAALFTPKERIEMLEPLLRDIPNVEVQAYEGLTMDFVRKCGGRVILRGIRDIGDLSDELTIANVNLAIGNIETIFMLTTDQHVLTSSTYVKQIYELGGGDVERLNRLVPPSVAARLAQKLGRPRSGRVRKR